VIPARLDSTRFQAKVLADICGKPMLQRVWEQARQARLLDDLIIACDSKEVAEASGNFGAKAVMTSRGHHSGTDRITEVVNPLDVRVVVNIQADEPLIHPTMIDSIIRMLEADRSLVMATVVKRIEDASLIVDPNVVKVVLDRNNFALYFSRAPIPFLAKNAQVKEPRYYKHIGLYGYTKDFLFKYKNIPPSSLEKTEKLEQLRVLEEGLRIKVVETNYDTISVDTAEDLERVRNYLKESPGGA
jgi:3-deoxy-manno-octulosonate cytidylyltransferase (CMP-KDO synthetase)